MKHLFLTVFLLISARADAQVSVRSGEHDGFTRLVMNYQEDVAWRVGRVSGEYGIKLERIRPDYDISKAFNFITKNRIASLFEDKNSGIFHIGLACLCHATAFELRPGIVVIDVKDGPPPKDSIFEAPILQPHLGFGTSITASETEAGDHFNKDGNEYNWIGRLLPAFNKDLKDELPNTTATNPDVVADQFGILLLEHLSRSASRGVVDIEATDQILPSHTSSASLKSEGRILPISIALGELPGITLHDEGKAGANIDSVGNICTPEEKVAISSWSNYGESQPQMSEVNDKLVEEFDKLNKMELESAVKFLLSIGFGAEARQLLNSLTIDAEEREILSSLSYLVDGEDDPKDFFSRQSNCKSSSALWSLLDTDANGKFDEINMDAIYLAFSSLSASMRNNLGPILVEKLLDHKVYLAAEKIERILNRSPSGHNGKNSLVRARLDLNAKDAISAENRSQAALLDAGPETWAALTILVEARAAQNIPIEAERAVALDAALREFKGTSAEPKIRRALIVAHALSSDFSSAFETLPSFPEAENDLWKLLANIGTDDDLLNFAILPEGYNYPILDKRTNELIVARLNGLGMTSAAAQWVERGEVGNEIDRANVLLADGEILSAVSLLAGNSTLEALEIRARALQKLGRNREAADLYSTLADAEMQQYALRQSRDWEIISEELVGPWKSAAELLRRPENLAEDTTLGTLSKANRSAMDTAVARETVISLLAGLGSGPNISP